MIAMTGLVLPCSAFAQAACPAAQTQSTKSTDAELKARDKAMVSQICIETSSPDEAAAPELPREEEGVVTSVEQLPDDIEVEDDEDGPEQHIVRNEISPEARLYQDISDVWQTIRQRGQQPTPELIAREIGPDLLARFLDQNPGAEAAFGQDSDQFPVPEPDATVLPDGTLFTLPAVDSGS